MTDPREEHVDLLGRLDGGIGPARRLSSARTAGMISAIADEVQTQATLAAPAPAPPVRRSRVALLAAAIVLVSASVAAATGVWLATADDPAAAPAVTPAPAPAPAPPPSAEVPAAPTAPVVIDSPAAEPPRSPPPRERPRRDATTAPAPLEDLLAAANQRRKEKRWRDAAALYEQVMRDHAGTDAAVVATVASASLHLDRLEDAAGALRRFQRALRARPAGPLAEEARWGIAEATRALGDDDDEAAALRAFIAAHPRSPRLDVARHRLGVLEAP